MKQPKALVMEGYGINCEYESAHCVAEAGGIAKRVHINDLVDGRERLRDYQILILPGGFSFADNLGAATVWAAKLKHSIFPEMLAFIRRKKLIIGVCNGFQAMAKLGILPATDGNYNQQSVTLTANEKGRFEDRWVSLRINPKSNCVFTRGVKSLYLPVRHGEGRFLPKDKAVLEALERNNQIVAQYSNDKGKIAGYPHNPNGSANSIAAVCDPSGRLFGIMPHPEAYNHRVCHPRWTREKLPEEGLGMAIFRNAVDYAMEHF